MKVVIDRVVLTNVSVREEEAEAFRGAVTTELARLVEINGLPSVSSVASLNVPLRDGNDLAADVAAALYGALGEGG
jgi:hypothetical protein